MNTIVGCGVYNIIANKINNVRFEAMASNKHSSRVTKFATGFLCPIAIVTSYTNIDDVVEDKWKFVNGVPERNLWCMPTFTTTPTIIYNIDDNAKENAIFLNANIRFIS